MVVNAGKKTRTGWKKTGRYAEADPLHSPADILAKAISLHQTGRLAEAEGLYRRILEADPVNADALHLLGVIAYQFGKNEQALGYIEKAIEINPEVSFFHNNLGNVLLNLDRKDEAAACFEEALCLMPGNVEASNNLGNIFRDRGRNRDAMEQYRKTIELNPDYAAAHNNLANLLKDTGRFNDAIIHYRKAIALMPDLPEIYLNFGSALNELNELDEAVEQYRKAIIIAPDFAEAYNDLGNVLKKQKRYDEAVQNYNKAITLKPEFAKAYSNLADAYREKSMFRESELQFLNAICLDPDNEKYYLNLGNTYFDQGKFNKAMEQYQKAIEIKPDFTDAHYSMGLILLLRGQLAEGWKEYEWRFQSKEISQDIGYMDMKVPVWDGSSLAGKTILIKSEQGMGDHIQFIRYMTLVKERGARVIYECPKELLRLFDAYEGIDVLAERPYSTDHYETPDAYIYLLSLPCVLGATIENISAEIPYLRVDKDIAAQWKSKFDNELFNVGLVWAGNPGHGNDSNRSCRLSEFLPLAQIPGVALYGLHKGGINKNGLKVPEGMQIIDIGEDIEDFYDTAAAIENMDLIITVDTAVAHLAGAMGKKVWILLSFVPDWRWMLDREDTPWYSTMRLFRQLEHRDWSSVINRVAAELRKICTIERSAT